MTILENSYGNGTFSVAICDDCKEYKIENNPNLIFHGINSEHLRKQSSPILVPKGNPTAPYYFSYLPKRFLHLGPISIAGLLSKDTDLFFGFDLNEIKRKYPQIQYMDFNTWEILAFHSNSLDEKQIVKLKRELFVPEYRAATLTEALLDELDCSRTKVLISKTEGVREVAKEFIGKQNGLECVLFEDGEKFFRDYKDHLSHECNCELSKSEVKV